MSIDSPVYLIELMDPHLAQHEKSDISRFLENALELVREHLLDFSERIDVEVTIDKKSKELAGIVFFNDAKEAIAVIRAYYLSREDVECENKEIQKVALGPLGTLEKNLNRIFTR